MTEHVLHTLVKRRAELAGDLDKLQGQIQQLHADLASLDAVIRQFDPDYRLDTIRPGTGARPRRPSMAQSVGRCWIYAPGHGPLSAKAMAQKIIAERGLNAGDRALARSMAKRVDMALRYQRTNGMVREARGGWGGGGLDDRNVRMDEAQYHH